MIFSQKIFFVIKFDRFFIPSPDFGIFLKFVVFNIVFVKIFLYFSTIFVLAYFCVFEQFLFRLVRLFSFAAPPPVVVKSVPARCAWAALWGCWTWENRARVVGCEHGKQGELCGGCGYSITWRVVGV